MIPLVVASERGTAQTSGVARRGWGCRTATLYANRDFDLDNDIDIWNYRKVEKIKEINHLDFIGFFI